MKKWILPLIVACFTGFYSCIDCVDGDGNIITENRTSGLGEFTEIELNGSFDLELKQDSTPKVIMEGDENILKLISTRVVNNKLIVETKSNKCFSSHSSIIMNVSAPKISRVILSGSGNVFCDSLSNNELNLRISGSGDMRFKKLTINEMNAAIEGSGNIVLSGVSNKSDFRIDGSGDVKAQNLEQKDCYVTVNGSGNVYTWFSNRLDGVINGSGNIVYKTVSGSVSVKVNGSGSVRRAN